MCLESVQTGATLLVLSSALFNIPVPSCQVLMAGTKLDEAEALCREVLATRTRVLAPQHPDTLGSMLNLGNVLVTRGKAEEAEPLFCTALEGYERVRGGLDGRGQGRLLLQGVRSFCGRQLPP